MQKLLETKEFLFQANPLLQSNYPIIEKIKYLMI
jgi:hypothetical protein